MSCPAVPLCPVQIKRIADLVDRDLSRSVPVPDMAAVCGLSVWYFCRAFKAAVGVSPSWWAMERRLEHVKKLLVESTMGLTDIAMECGFSEQSHMGRVFREHVGETPAAWRRRQMAERALARIVSDENWT